MAKAQTKTAFVLSLPQDMPASEVVEKAKATGIKIKGPHVHVIRSRAKGKAKGRKPTLSTATTTAATPTEREFGRLALELGIKKAEAILFDTRKKVAEIVAGS